MKPTDKFSGKADVYAKSRPGYPEEYLDYLVFANSLSGTSRVADIGSGTGILTRQLLRRGFSVIAVEPNEDMRIAAEEALKSQFSKFTSIKATAEETTLHDNSVDLVVAAQSFHWFNTEKFKVECKRILRPEGKVALVWNSRDFTSPLIIENAEICKKFCPNFYGFSGGQGEDEEVFKLFFRDGKYEYNRISNDLKLSLEGFLGRNLSASYAPKPSDKEYQGFIEAVTKLFEKYNQCGELVMPNFTRSYLGNV